MSKFYNVKNLVDFDENIIDEMKDLKNKHLELVGNWVFLDGKKILKVYVAKHGDLNNNALSVILDTYNVLNPNSSITKKEIKKIIKL